MGKCYSRLSFQERLVIQKLYKKGMTMAETEKIARIIGRNRTTIYREVLHNTGSLTTQKKHKKEQRLT